MKFSVTLFLGLSLGAMAQDPAAPKPETPSGGKVAPAKKVDPSALAVAEDIAIEENMITVQRAAQLYEKYSGKRVIMPNAIAKNKISFVMRGPLTNQEAYRFIQLSLVAERLAMMSIPEQPGIVRLISLGPIKPPGAIPENVARPSKVTTKGAGVTPPTAPVFKKRSRFVPRPK